jgi:carbon-monoxide dehydrogenase large subunit
LTTPQREPRRALARQPVEAWEDGARVDLYDKVTGRARYVDDLPGLPRMVYAVALRSSYAHARITSLDASRAEALPGVLGVLDRDHLDGLDPGVRVGEYAGRTREHGLTADQHFLTTDKARFEGDLLGMVAAVDLRRARQALELIKVG